jgi:hypothetical protein
VEETTGKGEEHCKIDTLSDKKGNDRDFAGEYESYVSNVDDKGRLVNFVSESGKLEFFLTGSASA